MMKKCRVRIEERRKEADARQAARDVRGDEEQLASLEVRGHGHCKEAQRLRDRLEDAKQGM